MYYIESLNDNIHKNSKNIDMVISDLTNAIKLDSSESIYYYMRADSYYNLLVGNKKTNSRHKALKNDTWNECRLIFDLAIADFKKSLSLDYNDPKPYEMLGDLYFESIRYKEAIISYYKYLEIAEFDKDIYARTYLRIGDSKLFSKNPEGNYCEEYKKSCDLGSRRGCQLYKSYKCKN